MSDKRTSYIQRLKQYDDQPGEYNGPWSQDFPHELRAWAESNGYTSLAITAEVCDELRQGRRKGSRNDVNLPRHRENLVKQKSENH